MTERRRWWRTKPAEYTAVITLAAVLISGGRLALSEMGFLPPITPRGQITALQAQQDTLLALADTNRTKHRILDSIPSQIQTINHRIDSLTITQEDAGQEREALLYMTCAIYRTTFPGSPPPQQCGLARRR